MEQPNDELLAPPEDAGVSRGRRFKLKNAIEIPLILIMFGATLGGTPTSNLMMYRTCVHALHHPVEECRSFLEPEAINHTKELEEEVQAYTTRVTTAKAVLEGAAPAVLAIFAGVWSDKHGRKPLIVSPVLGMTLTSMLMVAYSLLEDLGPWWMILTSIPVSLGGAMIVMLTGVYCYISDITPTESRSVGIVIIQVSVAISSTASGLISPYLQKAVGTAPLLLIVATLHTIAYAYAAVVIEESMEFASPGSILSIFNISHAKEMIRACFKKRPNHGRAIISLAVAASSLSIFTVYGSHVLLYLYSRNRIEWTMKDFTMFSSVSSAMWFTGSFVGVTVVQKLLHISDLNFIAISFLSCVAEFIIKTFATETWQMYLGSAVSLFGTISCPLIRSFLTKTLLSKDIAKVFGFMGAADAFLPLLSPLAYNSLYAFTIANFPQSIMVLTAVINVICFVLILIIQCLRSKSTSDGQVYQAITDEM